MTPQEVALVFGGTGIRTADEQRIVLAKVPATKPRLLVTTRHPKSEHGIPVTLLNGKLVHSWAAMEAILQHITWSNTAFAERCGISPQALQAYKDKGLSPQYLNVLRDLAEDYQLV